MTRPIIHLIPHTHWDREWYLPLGAFRARLTLALDAVLDQLDRDQRLASFLLDGQSVLVEDYLEVRPDRWTALDAMLAAGRLQCGPWYVLADEQIPAGESLVRNLLLGPGPLGGRARALPVLYSPDAFGHPGSLPLLAAEWGIPFCVLWRGVDTRATGNADLFWWEAQDGRRTLVYHLPRDGYEIGSNLLVPDDQLPRAWSRVAAEVLPRAVTHHVAVPVGADHHAPAPDLGGLAERLTRAVSGIEFRLSSLPLFFEAVRQAPASIATVRGEQRACSTHTWCLQGVHGTRAPLKRLNSVLELELTRTAEPLTALAGDAPRGAIVRQAWRELVQSHFHDAICGTAADEVARAARVRFDDVRAAAGEVVRASLDRLAGHDPDLARERGGQGARLLVWNRRARSVGGIVMADLTFFRQDVLVGPPGRRRARTGGGAHPFVLVTRGGNGSSMEIAPQVLSRTRDVERVDAARHYPDQDQVDRVRIAFPLPAALPGLGARLFQLRPGRRAAAEVFATGDGSVVRNGKVGWAVDRDGTCVLRRTGLSRPFTGLVTMESEADLGDTYSFSPASRPGRRRASSAGKARVIETGPLVAGLAWQLDLQCGRRPEGSGAGKVAASITAQVIGDSSVVRLSMRLDNRACDHRLRLRFPTGLRGAQAVAGTHFGAVRRSAAPAASPRGRGETPVSTAPGHRYVAVARGERGLALFAPGFFEYEWTRGGDLLVTLLRAVGELSRVDLPTRPGHAAWPTPTPDAQCLGEEAIEFGVAAVTDGDLARPSRLEELWEDAFLSPMSHWIRDYHLSEEEAAPDGLTLEGEDLVFSSLKPAEDGRGAVFRCFHANELPGTGRIVLARPLVRATRLHADEAELESLALAEGGRVVSFRVPARGIFSARLEWST